MNENNNEQEQPLYKEQPWWVQIFVALYAPPRIVSPKFHAKCMHTKNKTHKPHCSIVKSL